MTVTAHIALDVASKGMLFGSAVMAGVDRAMANSQARRAVAAHANAGLADRLSTARDEVDETLEVAHALALELARTRAENAALQQALQAERAQSIRLAMMLRQVAAVA